MVVVRGREGRGKVERSCEEEEGKVEEREGGWTIFEISHMVHVCKLPDSDESSDKSKINLNSKPMKH